MVTQSIEQAAAIADEASCAPASFWYDGKRTEIRQVTYKIVDHVGAGAPQIAGVNVIVRLKEQGLVRDLMIAISMAGGSADRISCFLEDGYVERRDLARSITALELLEHFRANQPSWLRSEGGEVREAQGQAKGGIMRFLPGRHRREAGGEEL